MEWTARYGRAIVRWRWAALLLPLVMTVGLAAGGRFLQPAGDYRIFFSEDNPQLEAFLSIQDTYTRIDNVLFAVEPQKGDVLEPSFLAAIEELTAAAWTLPHAIRVDSPTNFQHTRARDDDLEVADLIRDAESLSPARLDEIRRVATTEPALSRRLVAGDLGAVGVDVTLQPPGESLDEISNVSQAAHAIAEDLEARYPVRVELTGMVMLNDAFNTASLRDLSTQVPLMYLAIFVGLLVLVRSMVGAVGAMVVTVLSILSAMGTAGWFSMLITPPSAAAPTVIATLAVADSVHFLVSFFAARGNGMDRHRAVVESLRVNLQPIFLTSITTAIGFLSMNFSDTPPLRHLGNTAAFGVMMAFVFSVTLLPALMAIVPARGRGAAPGVVRVLDRFAGTIVRRRRVVLVLSSAFALVALAFLPRNSLRDDFVRYFDTSLEFRQAADFTNERLTGLYQLQYSVPSGTPGGVADPEFLATLDAFATWLRSQPEVRHVSAISDTFKRLNRSLHGDDPGQYLLPDRPDQAAQYLLLYELSLPYGLDLNNQLNVDKSATQVIATLNDMSSVELKAIAERGEAWLRENGGVAAPGVGPSIMFAHIADRTIGGMIFGTVLALIVISGLLVLALRSLRVGLLSLIPNLLPAGIAFGLWGFWVGEVNVGVSIVIGMTLGIVVDDTVHFLSKYLRARREHGASAEEAVRAAFRNVGVAILVTSAILIIGFGVLSFSVFAMNELMAKLTMLTIGMALVVDLTLLPALLVGFDAGRPKALNPPAADVAQPSNAAAEPA
ncbi:MAG: MMPL family transporter [Acidobacteriota bacterium]